ncbi:MAG: penicillin-binding protein 2 [bacterium]
MHVHCTRGEQLRERRHFQSLRIIEKPARRGDVTDRNGVILAMDVPRPSVYVEPARVEDPEKAAGVLAPVLGVGRGELLKKLRSRSSMEWLARGVGRDAAARVLNADLKCVGVKNEFFRYYPQNRSAAFVVGFKGKDEGLEGVERVYESWLAGTPERVYLEKDRHGRNVPSSVSRVIPGSEGNRVALTLDMTLQHFAETELESGLEKWRASQGSVIILEPRTGRVLALASEPGFDPNSDRRYVKNRAISVNLEPGSTMKAIIAAAAVEAGWNTDTKTFYSTGRLKIGPDQVKDAHPETSRHGWLSISDVIVYSSNVGAAQIGMELGARRVNEILNRFNFGRKLGIGLNGEESGIMPSAAEWRRINLATVAFGQGISATPLQMAAAYAAIANDGVMMKPSIVEKIVSPGGEALYTFAPKRVRRAVSAETARRMKGLLRKVVEEGTGAKAAVENYCVAGKTGTAQIPQGGGYSATDYIASFVGFVPCDEPRVLIQVIIEKPRGSIYGGEVAAPVFREIAKRTVWRLDVPPADVDRARLVRFQRKP